MGLCWQPRVQAVSKEQGQALATEFKIKFFETVSPATKHGRI